LQRIRQKANAADASVMKKPRLIYSGGAISFYESVFFPNGFSEIVF
jgi:hypothetical protein